MIWQVLALVLYLVSFVAMAYHLRAARKESQYWEKSYEYLVEIIKQNVKKEEASD